MTPIAFVATWVFVAAYLLVWTASGLLAYAGAVAAEAIAVRAPLSSEVAARIGDAILIAAGLYQLTPLKDRCLAKCRTPLGFIITSWREGIGGALHMGAEHGPWCLGCCWLLFVVLFPLGLMNVAAMALITLLICAEKSAPWGRLVVRAAAAVLVLYGTAILITPSLLPTLMPGEMAMSM